MAAREGCALVLLSVSGGLPAFSPAHYKMIRHLEHKPEIFDHIESAVFYQLYDENGVYGYAALDFTYLPDCIFHLEVTRFTGSVFESLKDDWLEGKTIMSQYGTKRVIVNHRSDEKDELWAKFVMRFGFKKPVKYITSHQEI